MKLLQNFTRYIQALALLTLQLFFILSSCEAGEYHLASKSPIKAVWMYRFSELDNKQTILELQAMEINLVFLSTDSNKLLPNGENASLEYTQKVRDFIKRAHYEKISVHAMTLEDPLFTLPKYHSQGAQLVKWIIAFCSDPETHTPFDGLHIDTESHSLPAWSDALKAEDWDTMEKIMQQYVQLLAAIHTTLQKSPASLPFSAATHWKNSEWAAEGKIPSANPNNLGLYLDFLVPMVYEITESAKIHSRSLDETVAMPTLVGISAFDFSKYQQLDDTTLALSENFKNSRNHLGVAIYKFSELKALYNKTRLLRNEHKITSTTNFFVGAQTARLPFAGKLPALLR
ncbi:MAG: hypothetical protein K9L22_06930 [Methylococcaceae bacterium]|nr:hypothetical protein [Methylococcaceae bacterium]